MSVGSKNSDQFAKQMDDTFSKDGSWWKNVGDAWKYAGKFGVKYASFVEKVIKNINEALPENPFGDGSEHYGEISRKIISLIFRKNGERN